MMGKSAEKKKRARVRAAAIIRKNDDVLLVRHTKDGMTYWLLPGGGVKFGETVEEALRREVKEETGLEVSVKELVLAHDSIPPDIHRHIINLYFTADLKGGELVCGSDPRLSEARFVPITELKELSFVPDVREQIAGILNCERGKIYLGNIWRELK